MLSNKNYLISTIIMICTIIITIQAASAAPVLSIEPAYIEVLPGDSFTLDIMVDPDGTEVYGAQYELYFDNTLLNVLEQKKVSFLSQDGAETIAMPNKYNNTIGKAEYGETRIGVTNGVLTKGILSSITFKALKSGICELNPSDVILGNVSAVAIPDVQINNGSVKIINTITPGLELSISADPTTVTVSTPTDVTFTVTDGTTPVEGAEITLTDCATGTGTTCAAGTAVISVDATSAGTITATASKEDYTSADITITAQEEEVNGYKGDKPLTTYRHDTTTGDLYFSHGDSFYSGKIYPDATYTVTHDVTLPDGATVEFARLYNYWTWSASGSTGKYPTMTLTINDNEIDPDAKYDDRKGWGSVYDYPAGTWAYDVTSQVTGSGTYTTVVTNTDTDSKSFVCMDGIGLLIVYNDPNGQQIEYWINEGADMLSTMDTSGGVTAQEATTISLFSGSVDLGSVESARLWTVVQSGGNEDNKLIFNAAEWTGVYGGTPYSDLDIDEARDVKDNLVASDNIAKIQAAPEATGGDYLMPSNAFLVLNIGGTPIPALSISANPTNVFVSDPTDVTFTVTSDGTPVEDVGISLSGCADGSGTTDATGVVVISVNATSAGTITATASKDGYTSADTTLTTKEQGQGASSSVSLSVEIKPAISFIVTPDNINFGDLSPGETSAAQTLTLENNGGLGFTVTAQVSDNPTEDTLFKNGLLLDSAVWGDYTISIDAQTSDDTDASLSVPVDYMEVGQKQGKIVFWAQA